MKHLIKLFIEQWFLSVAIIKFNKIRMVDKIEQWIRDKIYYKRKTNYDNMIYATIYNMSLCMLPIC